MKKTVIGSIIITFVIIIGTIIFSLETAAVEKSMQINTVLLPDAADNKESQTEELLNDSILDTVYVNIAEKENNKDTLFIEYFLKGKLYVYEGYIFDFREDNLYYGFFTSAMPYVDGYKYKFNSEETNIYLYIIDPNEKKCVKWKIVTDDDILYLLHEDSGTIIPLKE